jgi:hypothetical protein
VKKMKCFAPVLLLCVATCSAARGEESKRDALRVSTASVQVLAFDTRGPFLGAPNVSLFESFYHKNLAGKFHGGLAEGIPYGVYRIEGRLPAYSSEARYVVVYGPKVTIYLGLAGGIELPATPTTIHGRVVGLPAAAGKACFVKLVGVFSSESMESPVGSDGGFDFSGLSDGRFLLLVVTSEGVLASRLIDFPYSGPSLEIDLRRDHGLPAN